MSMEEGREVKSKRRERHERAAESHRRDVEHMFVLFGRLQERRSALARRRGEAKQADIFEELGN